MRARRRAASVEGVVQGVGFRPFVARLATELGLRGWVRNEGRAVAIEVEGPEPALDAFARRLVEGAPPAARIERVRWSVVAQPAERDVAADFGGAAGGFVIAPSVTGEGLALTIPADLATCAACRAEVDDPSARRFAYPFTNCTACGPRFTIVEALPYDRARTTMAAFPRCEACRREHDDPADRRFHAQPIACPACGPALRLCDARGAALATRDDALGQAVEALRRGAIVALKGLGGWQLLCDAGDEAIVARLRARKRRPHQAFAVLVAHLDGARAIARLDADEEAALASPAAPIVLVRARAPHVARHAAPRLAPNVAPDNARVGVMLPTTPLHHLVAARFGGPLVCTSGNHHDEPIATGDAEALARLGAIADVFLGHDRAIARRVDDALVHVVDHVTRTLRLGRGLAPLGIGLPSADPEARLLCLGGHLKSAPAALVGREAVLWPHVGDLDTLAARDAFERALGELRDFLRLEPTGYVCDAHPDYASTLFAEGGALPITRVQHHHAHVAACLAEHGLDEALGFAWDGVGMGDDGAAWGGEALYVDPEGARRVAHLHPFPLPGGDAAAREPRRALAGALVAAGLPAELQSELVPPALIRLARVPRLAPPTTSAGRLFDAVAALAGVCGSATHEGQAPIALEAAAGGFGSCAAPYEFRLEGPVMDWRPALRAMVAERHDVLRVAARFHATLVAMIVAVAERERPSAVVLTGGCFQNATLAAAALDALRERGHHVLLPARVPPNDGGLALGQAWVAARRAR
ncbi:MAG: carbamoyltransferase HypF [Myxococcales bacterium]|nr:carbamoyltransferase HypF [Myxococcales bacterium]